MEKEQKKIGLDFLILGLSELEEMDILKKLQLEWVQGEEEVVIMEEVVEVKQNMEDVDMELPTTSFVPSAITGVEGLRPSDILLRRIRVKQKVLGDKALASGPVPEKVGSYPGCRQFKHPLPAYGFYLRHADRVTFDDVSVVTDGKDVREAIVADDSTWNDLNRKEQAK